MVMKKGYKWHKYNNEIKSWLKIADSKDVLPQTRGLARKMIRNYTLLRDKLFEELKKKRGDNNDGE